MKFSEFKRLVRDYPVISTQELLPFAKNKQVFLNQISGWKQRGLLLSLKKGLYVLNEQDRKLTPSREFIANQLVFPSYVSLEYALGYYNLIPERVYQVTSVTSKKTTEFENAFGTFTYHSLKRELFFGYNGVEDENGLQVLIAVKEKALLDYLYLKTNLPDARSARDFLTESLRIEGLDQLDEKRLSEFAQRFQSSKVQSFVSNILQEV